MPRTGSRQHMTREQASQVKVGDVILVGLRKDERAVVKGIYGRGIAPPYFGTTLSFPPFVPGGGTTGIGNASALGGGFVIPGSTPAGGGMTLGAV